MKRPVKTLAFAVMVSSVLVGCATKQTPWRPSAAEIAAADHGAYPANYQKIVRAWYRQNLKDPDSARFGVITRPLKEHAIMNQFRKEAVYGYTVCAHVNARNSYGGYTGMKTRWFLIRNGQIVRSAKPKYGIYIGRPYRCIDGPETAS